MRFYGNTTDKTDMYVEVDGIGTHLNMNYQGYSSDATSRTTYRRRMELQQDSLIVSSTEALDLGDSIKEKKKDPLEHITLIVDGNSCISGGNFKLWPGYKVTLNFPKIGMTNEVWRVETVELKCFPHQDISGHGHDFTAKLDCVPETTKVDFMRWGPVAKRRSLIPFLSGEAFKRRSNRKWLP